MSEESTIEDFISALQENCRYWANLKEKTDLEKIEGATHSILVMLDGLSGSFNGDAGTVFEFNAMLHEEFYKNVSTM